MGAFDPKKQFRLILASAVLAVATLTGCSRAFYREQADADVYNIVDSAASDPRWPLAGYTIAVDPQSRMYDPNNPDSPPMPPDDAVSHEMMHCVDCKAGYPCWHANGDTDDVENPDWLEHLPLNHKGQLVLGVDDAVRVALLHSPDFQEENEELYLSALDVTFERFRFDTQFFGGYGVDYQVDGALRSRSGNDASTLTASTFPASRGLRAQRMYATGSELVIGLANSLVWQFSGPDSNNTTTLLDFALLQPLLRAGGRARVLERLTISERSLLANVRQMERFRRGFYLEIVTGENAGSGPSRRGGFFGGSGLEGFSGVGGGGFGRIGGTQSTGGFGGVAGGAGAAEAGGYIGLLQDQLTIRNQEGNIAALRSSLAQLEAFYQAGRIDFFQVELARQALFNAESLLLTARARYGDSVDRYKADLGLPPQLDVVVSDPMLAGFNIIDPRITQLQNELAAIQIATGRTVIEILNRATVSDRQPGQPPVQQQRSIVWDDRLVMQLRRLETHLTHIGAIQQRLIDENLKRAESDLQSLNRAIGPRKAELQRLSTILDQGWAAGGSKANAPQIINIDRLEKLPIELEQSHAKLKVRFNRQQQQLAQLDGALKRLVHDGPQLGGNTLFEQIQNELIGPIPAQLAQVVSNALDLSLLQARARTESISLASIDLDSDHAIEIARQNRRDWMNARASLVDTWRLIEFNANDLESSLDIVLSGDISNTGDNPIDLRGSKGRLRVGLEFDAPITRLGERNTYRQAQIEYQQARRSFYEFRDRVARGLRRTLRTIELNQLNFELRRAAIHVAISQVELAQLRLQRPPRTSDEETFSDTTARDLVTALSDLLSVQNDFLSVWVDFEVRRRELDFDLGTMRLDEDGIWIDPGKMQKVNVIPPQAQQTSCSIEIPVEISQAPSNQPEISLTTYLQGPSDRSGVHAASFSRSNSMQNSPSEGLNESRGKQLQRLPRLTSP